jgi:phosphoribosylformylglycinamidine synthase II
VPTVGGTVYFDPAYAVNPVVNVMCVGLVKRERIVRGIARGKGNPILYAGATTGRDGIHGATFASEELSEKSEAKRPSVQIGDPFTKKSLIEACLELVRTDLIVGMQDMGAAGLTSSSIEMASRGRSGIELDLSRIPLREARMTPYEIMLSESQERMVIIGKKGTEKKIKKIFDKWGLHFAVVGRVTDDGKVRVRRGKRVYAEIPVASLVSDAPIYKKEVRMPGYIRRRSRLDPAHLKKPKSLERTLLALLRRPTLASKEWVYRQYDHQVRTNTVLLPGADASVLRIRDTNKAIALTTDCNGRYTYLNPYRGGAIAVAEAARNLACCGAKPLGITDCLNFGNPDDPEILWQFREAVRGMSAACKALDVPVISGNVSFYNESPTGAVHPTPVVGMVGLIEPVEDTVTPWFKDEGDTVILLGPLSNGEKNLYGLGGSEYAAMAGQGLKGDCPEVDLRLERSIGLLLREASSRKLLKSAHDCAEGGLGVALAECCFTNPEREAGASLRIPAKIRPDFLLFNESQGRVIVTTRKPNEVLQLSVKHGVRAMTIGVVVGTILELQGLFKIEVARMAKAWREAIPDALSVGR